MQQHFTAEPGYCSLLKAIRDDLKFALSKVGTICNIYKQISKKLILSLKAFTLIPNKMQIQIQPILIECLQLLTSFLQETQFEKYGHILPAFKLITQRYVAYTGKKAMFQNKLLTQGIDINQKTNFTQKLTNIQKSEIDFLEGKKIQNFFKEAISGQVILQDPKCFFCSRVLIKDAIIENQNPYISILAQLSLKQCMDKPLLLKTLCAICNQGGGALIIGAKRNEGTLIAKGIQFNSSDEVDCLQKEIRTQALQVKPKCIFKIDRVSVHLNNVGQIPNPLKICLRVLIYPQKPTKISYIEFQNKGYHSLFQFYQFNSELKPIKLTNNIDLDGKGGVYEKMLQVYRVKKSYNLHKNISCYAVFSGFCRDLSEQNHMIKEENKSSLEQFQIKMDNRKLENQLKFKYRFTSLVIVSSKKSQRYIETIQSSLTKLKELFEVEKPFQESFEGSARSVWMLSHDKSYNEMKNILIDVQQKTTMKPGAIIMMPVYKGLQIQKKKLSQYNQSYLLKKFSLRYNQQPQLDSFDVMKNESGATKKMIKLTFANYSQAIFAYMVFQQLQLRPYFVKT